MHKTDPNFAHLLDAARRLVLLSNVVLWMVYICVSASDAQTPFPSFNDSTENTTGCWDYCLKVVSLQGPASVYDARQVCLTFGGDIAGLANITEYSIVEYFLQGQPLGELVMFGLYYNGTLYSWLDPWTPWNATIVESKISNMTARPSWQPLEQYCHVMMYHNDTNVLDFAAIPCCYPPSPTNVVNVLCKIPNIDNSTDEEISTIFDDVPPFAENATVKQHFCQGNCSNDWINYMGQCYRLVNTTVPNDGNLTLYHVREACLDMDADMVSINSLWVQNLITLMLYYQFDYYNTSNGNYRVFSGSEIVWVGWLLSASSYVNVHSGSSVSPNLTSNVTGRSNATNCTGVSNPLLNWDSFYSSSVLTMTLSWRALQCCIYQQSVLTICQKPLLSSVTRPDNQTNIAALECDINQCTAYTPCQNNGTCTDLVFGYNCSCVRGFNGTNCSQLNEPCFVWNPCKNGANCSNTGLETYQCSCAPGWNGTNCTIDINECDSNPCVNNGSCNDFINGFKCNCSIKYTGVNCASEIKCDNISSDTFPNASVAYHFQNPAFIEYNDVITVTCVSGYLLDDLNTTRNMTCSASAGGWTPTLNETQCFRHCNGFPKLIANSQVYNRSSKVGQTVSYQCNTGFRFPDNSTSLSVTCNYNQSWSMVDINQIPNSCDVIHCPVLPVKDNQHLLSTSTDYNTTVVFYCAIGYSLWDNTTARSIRCLLEGQWTAYLPDCLPVTCPAVQTLINGTSNTSLTTYNTYVTYTCNGALRMVDGSTTRTVKCDADREWNGNITDCSDDRCFPLPYVANTTAPSTTNAIIGTVVSLTCIPGHFFTESLNNQTIATQTMTCSNTKIWSPPYLSGCQPVFCPNITTVMEVNSNTNTYDNIYDTVATVTCLTGYYMYVDGKTANNTVITQCQQDGNWSINVMQPCWPIQCPEPNSTVNGTNDYNSQNSDARNFSSIVKYYCDTGYLFIDGNANRSMICQSNGTWNQSDLSCRVDRCKAVPQSPHTVPSTHSTSWNSTVTYTCEVGYDWPQGGTYWTTCIPPNKTLEFGLWSFPDIPPCYIKNCTAAPEVAFASNNASHLEVISYGMIVQYSCIIGYEFSGNLATSSILCTENATYSPSTLDNCTIIHCPELTAVENSTLSSNDTYYNVSVTYSCLTGYNFADKTTNKTAVCAANKTWTNVPTVGCQVLYCPPIPTWINSNFNSTNNDFAAAVSYSCQSGYTFKDGSTLKQAVCLQNKQWSPPLDSCQSVANLAAEIASYTVNAHNAVSIGTIACTLMGLLLAGIVLLDSQKLLSDFKVMKSNISSFLNHLKSNQVSDSSTNIRESNA